MAVTQTATQCTLASYSPASSGSINACESLLQAPLRSTDCMLIFSSYPVANDPPKKSLHERLNRSRQNL